MGQNNSVDTNTEFDTKVINETVQAFTSDVANRVLDAVYTNASITIVLGDNATLTGCDITATNKVDSSNKSAITTMVNNTAQLSAEQQSAISSDIQKQIQQKNQDLGFLQSNTVNDSTTVSNEIISQINQSFKSSVKNEIGSITQTSGEIKFTAGKNFICNGSKIFLSNDLVVEKLNTSILNSVNTYIAGSNQTNTILNKYKLEVSQTNAGLNLNFILYIIALIIVIFTIVPLFVGGGLLKTFSTYIMPILVVAGVVGTIIFTLNRNWIPAFICLGVSWVVGLTRIFSSGASKSVAAQNAPVANPFTFPNPNNMSNTSMMVPL